MLLWKNSTKVQLITWSWIAKHGISKSQSFWSRLNYLNNWALALASLALLAPSPYLTKVQWKAGMILPCVSLSSLVKYTTASPFPETHTLFAAPLLWWNLLPSFSCHAVSLITQHCGAIVPLTSLFRPWNQSVGKKPPYILPPPQHLSEAFSGRGRHICNWSMRLPCPVSNRSIQTSSTHASLNDFPVSSQKPKCTLMHSSAFWF